MNPARLVQELEKIAFFLQHSGLFDKFAPRTRAVLESLPVEWSSAETGGEIMLDWQQEPTWETAHLDGMLKDIPFKMDIKRDSSRYTYKIIYDGKEYQTTNLTALKTIVNNLVEGEVPKPKVLKACYDLLQSKKTAFFDTIVKHYLAGVTELSWQIKLQKDTTRIYARFYVILDDVSLEEGHKKEIMSKLKEHNFYRPNGVGSFLKKQFVEEGLDVESLQFNRKFIDLRNQAGFIITIK